MASPLQNKLHDLISQGKIDEVFDILLIELLDSVLLHELILLLAHWYYLKREYKAGYIVNERYYQERNHVIKDLHSIVDTLNGETDEGQQYKRSYAKEERDIDSSSPKESIEQEDWNRPMSMPSTKAPSTSPSAKSKKNGRILHNIPSTMSVGKESRCTVRIAFDEETLLDNFAKTKDTKIESIGIAKIMKVELIDFNEIPTFVVRTVTDDRQLILKNDYTQWLFMVKALREGKHSLTLKVTAIIESKGTEHKHDIVYEKEIDILTDSDSLLNVESTVPMLKPLPIKPLEIPFEKTDIILTVINGQITVIKSNGKIQGHTDIPLIAIYGYLSAVIIIGSVLYFALTGLTNIKSLIFSIVLVLLVIIVGTFQLKNDERLGESSFKEIILIILKKMSPISWFKNKD